MALSVADVKHHSSLLGLFLDLSSGAMSLVWFGGLRMCVYSQQRRVMVGEVEVWSICGNWGREFTE